MDEPIPIKASDYDARQVESLASQFVAKYALPTGKGLYGKLLDVVDTLGGAIREYVTDPGQPIPPGLLIPGEGGMQFDIYLVKDDPPRQKTMDLCHELGHLIVQYPDMVRRAQEEGKPPPPAMAEFNTLDRKDMEANWFAMAVLMPERLLVKAHQATPGDISRLSDEFEAPHLAAEARVAILLARKKIAFPAPKEARTDG